MEKTVKSRFRWGMAALVAPLLVLTACGGGGGAPALDINVQVDGWPAVHSAVHVSGFNPSDPTNSVGIVASGQITETGQLTVRLTAPDPALLGNPVGDTEVSVDDAAARVTVSFIAPEELEGLGQLVIADSRATAEALAAGTDAVGSYSEAFLYADRPLHITGQIVGDTSVSVTDYRASFGWNVSRTDVSVEAEGMTFTSSVGDLADFNWYWVEY